MAGHDVACIRELWGHVLLVNDLDSKAPPIIQAQWFKTDRTGADFAATGLLEFSLSVGGLSFRVAAKTTQYGSEVRTGMRPRCAAVI
eukprot:COSAG02_NODE_1691_length_11296_cov_7.891757_14_plen_87_part_00